MKGFFDIYSFMLYFYLLPSAEVGSEIFLAPLRLAAECKTSSCRPGNRAGPLAPTARFVAARTRKQRRFFLKPHVKTTSFRAARVQNSVVLNK